MAGGELGYGSAIVAASLIAASGRAPWRTADAGCGADAGGRGVRQTRSSPGNVAEGGINVQKSRSRRDPCFRHEAAVLTSDLLLVKPVGTDRWVQFRDVFEVDGKPVHDRSERLVKLFLEPTGSSARQVEQIAAESSRYNIGSVQRTINVPVLALLILDRAHSPRFHFERSTDRKARLGGEPRSSAATDVWVIEYDEVRSGTIIRTTNDRDLPAHGRFWIEAASGRVVASELVANDPFIRGTIDVTYQLEPALDLFVPVEMRERYEVRKDGSKVEGTATYSKFRQFQVKVDEKIAPIK